MDRRLLLFAIVSITVLVGGMAVFAYRVNPTTGSSTQVVIVNSSFSPSNLTVPVGATVRWINMDHVSHTVSFGIHGDESGVESGLLDHMGSFSYTFAGPGRYEYHCDPHPFMTGEIIVVA